MSSHNRSSPPAAITTPCLPPANNLTNSLSACANSNRPLPQMVLHPHLTAFPPQPAPIPPDPPDPTLLQLQRAHSSPDPHELTKLVRSLIGPRDLNRFREIRGPDSHPLTLGTIELFCWGSYQSNFMIEDTVTTLARLYGLTPSHLIPQPLIQPLLERAEPPQRWLHPNSNFYTSRNCTAPLDAPLLGVLHLSNHFVTIYICREYWTVSDPLDHTPSRTHPIPVWEDNLHTALTVVYRSLNIPPVLPPYLPLPTPLSTQSDRHGAWSCGTHAMLTSLHILMGTPPHSFPTTLSQTQVNHFHTDLLSWLLHGRVPPLPPLPSSLPATPTYTLPACYSTSTYTLPTICHTPPFPFPTPNTPSLFLPVPTQPASPSTSSLSDAPPPPSPPSPSLEELAAARQSLLPTFTAPSTQPPLTPPPKHPLSSSSVRLRIRTASKRSSIRKTTHRRLQTKESDRYCI